MRVASSTTVVVVVVVVVVGALALRGRRPWRLSKTLVKAV